MTFEQIILVVGGTFTGLVAGLFYSFTVAIVPALRTLKGKEHIAAMQAINTKIENPLFFLSFFGALVFLPLTAYLYRDKPAFPLLVAASILYILGAIGATVFGDIPLNEELAKVETPKISEEEAEKIRKEFQGSWKPWMRFHAVRTLAATAATTLVLVACLWK